MMNLAKKKNPEYVVIGHITEDITPDGLLPGGTALYSALTAHALGMRVGVVSSHQPGFRLPFPADIQVSLKESENTTRFENTSTDAGRVQVVYQKALDLDGADIPAAWLTAPILHLGPVANEVDPNILQLFPNALRCLTPQGWMRSWDPAGKVHFQPWLSCEAYLPQAHIACFSLEDIQYNEKTIEDMTSCVPILAVTEAHQGARIYWNGDLRHFKAPRQHEVDVTGAGDIFAAAFFYRYYHTRNPWEAARFANLVASSSVTRKGLDSIPEPQEMKKYKQEIIQDN